MTMQERSRMTTLLGVEVMALVLLLGLPLAALAAWWEAALVVAWLEKAASTSIPSAKR
jgi:hypothetical protein